MFYYLEIRVMLFPQEIIHTLHEQLKKKPNNAANSNAESSDLTV